MTIGPLVFACQARPDFVRFFIQDFGQSREQNSFMLRITEFATRLASCYVCLKLGTILTLPHDVTVRFSKSMHVKNIKVCLIQLSFLILISNADD